MHFALGLVLSTLLAWPVSGAESVAYCSSVNTGSSYAANSSIYQSSGRCQQTCNSDYAFGILQGKLCWCSNIAPNQANSVDPSKCNDGCPGYPQDSCGSESDGLFAYIEMSLHMASGTASAASATGTATGTSSSDSTTTGSSTISVQTSNGVVQTVTVSGSDSTSMPDGSTGSSNKGSSGLSGGAVAGVAVGCVAGAIAIAVIVFLIFLNKRRTRASSPNPSVQNTLLDGRNSKGSQMSFMKGMFSDGHSHTLSTGSSVGPGRLPTFTDNRMNTNTALYPDGRRHSNASLQDNEDYTRPVLRLTNPD